MAATDQGSQLALLRSLLIDTGPIVAYLNWRDVAHDQVALILDRFSGQLHSTSAVITEAMHFASRTDHGPALLAEFATRSRMRIHDFAQPSQLWAATELMSKYSDTPMDYADATLVLLAEQLSLPDVLTLDRRGFSVYRMRNGPAFRIAGTVH